MQQNSPEDWKHPTTFLFSGFNGLLSLHTQVGVLIFELAAARGQSPIGVYYCRSLLCLSLVKGG